MHNSIPAKENNAATYVPKWFLSIYGTLAGL